MQPITARLNGILSTSSVCEHPGHLIPKQEIQILRLPKVNEVEMLSLECAFDWLRISYVELFDSVVHMISEDQDEPLPLNWAVLLEDWDRTYWIVWIYIMLILNGDSGGRANDVIICHSTLKSWMDYVQW